MTFALLDPSDLCYAVSNTQPDAGKWVLVPPGTGDPVGKRWTGWEFQAPRWTSYEFLQRFTTQERRLAWNRAKNDDDIAEFLMFAQAANEVLSDDPATVAGMNLLVSKNVITAARKAEILS